MAREEGFLGTLILPVCEEKAEDEDDDALDRESLCRPPEVEGWGFHAGDFHGLRPFAPHLKNEHDGDGLEARENGDATMDQVMAEGNLT